MSKPAGQEADELLQVVDSMTYMVALSLKYHLLSGDITDNTATYRKVLENIGECHQQHTRYWVKAGDLCLQ